MKKDTWTIFYNTRECVHNSKHGFFRIKLSCVDLIRPVLFDEPKLVTVSEYLTKHILFTYYVTLRYNPRINKKESKEEIKQILEDGQSRLIANIRKRKIIKLKELWK